MLDVLNPQDFREFVLDDFEDSRIPLWSVNAEVPLGPLVAQLVWIPDRTYHDLPEPGATLTLVSGAALLGLIGRRRYARHSGQKRAQTYAASRFLNDFAREHLI